jgi:hypothetical protein
MLRRAAAVLSAASSVLCVMCSTPQASIDATSECAALAAECPRCTEPGPKQECQTAVSGADETTCAAILDDPGIIAACSSDGGTASDAPPDAPLPQCDAAGATPGAGCACGAACGTSCVAGGCDVTCVAGGDGGAACAPGCPGGRCTFRCAAGATCAASCAGGGCLFVCEAGSTCENTCAGGGCTFQCADGAVCSDSCAVDGGCVGY